MPRVIRKLKKYISDSNRLNKYNLAISFINEDDNIIDIGVDPTLGGNTNYFEKYFNLHNKLTCLAVHNDFKNFKNAFPDFELLQFDGINFPSFKEKFDFAFSNAVIEHVGPYAKQKDWLIEVSKLAKLLFITTPNKWLPFETHTETFFFHWFPDNVRNYFYRKIGKQEFTDNYMWLLGESDLRKVIKESGFDLIKFKRNKFLFFTIDFVAICVPSN